MPAEEEKSAKSADDWLIEPSDPPLPEPQGGGEEFALDNTALPAREESIGPETEQWLVPADAGRNGHAKKPEPPLAESPPVESAAPAPAPKPKRAKGASGSKRGDSKKLEQAKESLREQREVNADLAKRLRELQTELRMQAKRAKSELAQALKERDAKIKQERDAEAEKRVSRLEAELTKQHEAREAELRGRIEELEAALAEEKKLSRAKRTTTATRKTAPAAGKRRTAKSTRPKRTGAKNGKLELNEAKFEELRELGLSVTQSARLIAYRDVRGGYESLDELGNIPGLSKETLAELHARLTVSS